MGRSWRYPLVGFAVASAAALLDQATKALVSAHLSLYESVKVWGSFLRITHTRNPGIAFGVSLGVLNGLFLTLLTGAGVAALTVYLVRHGREGMAKASMIGLVLGGAVGNLIDRFRLGEVVDFLDVGLGSYRWPVFNLADTVVVIGVASLLLIERQPPHRPTPPS